MRARTFSSSISPGIPAGDALSRRHLGLRRRICHLGSKPLAAGLLGLGLTLTAAAPLARCEGVPGYYTDPKTGQVYRQITRTVERPEVTTTTERRERTVWTPKTVRETRPHARTLYTPVTEYRWVPRLHHRWNPFREPTVVYHHEPTTHWQARNEVVEQTTARTEWVAEKRVDEVPVTHRRIVREQRVEREPVGSLAPQQADPPGGKSAVASRLRPLDSSELARIVPNGSVADGSLPNGRSDRPNPASPGASIATNPYRSATQSGQRATDLVPSSEPSYRGTIPAGSIATPPGPLSIFR